MFNELVDAMSSSAWTYLLVFAIAALDAVLPILPGETMVVAGGVLAATGDLHLVLVMAAGAAGAIVGDTASYALGRRFGPAAALVLARGERGKRSMAWADRTLQERGGTLIAVARFVPGGRTATTFTAGTTGFSLPRFLIAVAIGGTLWGIYSGLIGAIGGRTFEEHAWKGIVLAVGLAIAVGVLVETVRWLVARRRRRGRH